MNHSDDRNQDLLTQEKDQPQREEASGVEKTSKPLNKDVRISDKDFNPMGMLRQVFSEDSPLQTTTRSLLASLIAHANHEGTIDLTLDEVMVLSGIRSNRTVRNHLDLAIEEGLLQIIYAPENPRKRRYVLILKE